MTTPSILSCCRDKAYLITNIEIIWLSNQFKGTAVLILCCITLIGIKVINLTTCIVSRNWDDGKIKITFVYIGVSNESVDINYSFEAIARHIYAHTEYKT